jgi:DNA-directed RNA polymerase II subunit RPB9
LIGISHNLAFQNYITSSLWTNAMADNWNDDDEEQQHEDAAMYEQEDEDDDILDMGDDEQPQSQDTALLMRFCPHDSSMLYPQEDKRTRTLRYACRRCRYTEESTQPLIYRNLLKKEVGNVLNNVPSAVSDDPTLARSQNINCASCGHHEAVFFQSDTSDARSDTLALIFVCCNCDYKWVG